MPTPSTPASYWAAAAPPETSGSQTSRLLLAWAIALVVVAFNTLVASRTGDPTPGTPRWFGYVVGTALAPFVIALVLRAILVAIRSRSGQGSRSIVRSIWLPLGAVILAGLNLGGNIASLAPPRPVDVNAVMFIGAPFTLREASADTIRVAEPLTHEASIRSYAVREVVGEDGSVSILIVADAALRSNEIDGVARGIEETAGTKSVIESIGGRDVVVATAGDVTVGAWIEEPMLISVYAADPTHLRAVIEAFLATRPT